MGCIRKVLVIGLIGWAAALATAVEIGGQQYLIKTITINISEPNFAVNGAYHELEEGLLTKAMVSDDKALSPLDAVLCPLKDIIESLDGAYAWDEAKKQARITLNGHTITVTLGEKAIVVDGKSTVTALAATTDKGSVFLPIRPVLAGLGGELSWDRTRGRLSAVLLVKPTTANRDLAKGGPYTFEKILAQKPEWYGGPDAQKIAEVIVGFQNKDGGWIKLETDVDMTKPISGPGALNVRVQSTIDNNSTFTEMKFLARAYQAGKTAKYLASFAKGLDYVLRGQYANGGWPQFLTDPVGYQKRITYNDNAMANILNVLRQVASRSGDFAFADNQMVAKCQAAFDKGLDCILRSQIVANGQKTAWCAQIDEQTLAPVTGRAYELPSISGQESVAIVQFLMSIDKPSPQVIEAIQSAVAWLNSVRVNGLRVVTKADPTLEFGGDRQVVSDAAAPPLWGRFYEIGTNKPFFSSRDGIKKYALSEISYERRNKYSWYTQAPTSLLARDYPAWQAQWARTRNVLAL